MLDVLEYHINNEKFRNNIIASLMNVYITIIIHYILNVCLQLRLEEVYARNKNKNMIGRGAWI
jgi:hypothetical protein